MNKLNQLLAIREFCASCTIPVIAENRDKIGSEATGSLFKFDDRLFFITATHVSDLVLAHPDMLGIPIGKIKSQILTFKDCIVHGPQKQQDKNKYDIGVIELTKNHLLCNELLNQFNPLSISNIGKFYSRANKYYLAGYPAERAEKVSDDLLKSQSIFMFETTIYKDKVDENIKINPESDIFLEYSKSIVTEKGMEVAAPALHEISGGTIWEVDESQFSYNGIWSAEKTVKLVAIQCSYEQNNYKWIRGVKLNVLAHIFGNIEADYKRRILEQLK